LSSGAGHHGKLLDAAGFLPPLIRLIGAGDCDDCRLPDPSGWVSDPINEWNSDAASDGVLMGKLSAMNLKFLTELALPLHSGHPGSRGFPSLSLRSVNTM